MNRIAFTLAAAALSLFMADSVVAQDAGAEASGNAKAGRNARARGEVQARTGAGQKVQIEGSARARGNAGRDAQTRGSARGSAQARTRSGNRASTSGRTQGRIDADRNSRQRNQNVSRSNRARTNNRNSNLRFDRDVNRIGNQITDWLGLDGRNRFDRDWNRNWDRNWNRDWDRNWNRNRIGNRGNSWWNNGRYRNPIASFIFREFPQARSVLAPRQLRNRGVFYRNNGRHYYYPWTNDLNVGVQQASGTYIDGDPSNIIVGSDEYDREPVPVEFGGWEYMDELAPVMPQVLNELCLDMYYNYRSARNFDPAYRDAYAMLEASKELRAAQKSGDQSQVKEHLKKIDRMLHQVEDQTQGWTRTHTRQIGELGLITKLQVAGDMTHHMMHDAGISEKEHDDNNRSSDFPLIEEAPAPDLNQ